MPFKRWMKRAARMAARLAPRPDTSSRRVVFCYHSVHPHRAYASTKPDEFDRHVKWLKQHCRLTSLVELMAGPATSGGGKPVAAITFDDGHEDNHSYALPILARHGVTATFFITAGFVDRDPAVLERFRELWLCGPDDVVPLDWRQVRELHASGMDIGSHTYSHPNLARLSPAEVEDELRRSKALIVERTGASVDLFAYPFGKPAVHFTPATTDAVRATGHRLAAAITSRGVRDSDSPFSIPRFFADGDDVAKIEAKVGGAYDLVGWWQDHAPLSVRKVVSPEDFEK
jgi:peptidoglycan/xylan/chitin deacetylase (PgdA/CDA1 family)